MEMRRLGQAGPLVSVLGLGTVKIGRNQGVKYPQEFALPKDEAVVALLQAAADLGVNLLDTAPAYGTAEQRLGALLPKVQGRKRQDWVIVTKAGEFFEQGQSRFDFSAAAITASVLASLERLHTDYVDAVLLHSDGEDEAGTRFDPAWSALLRLKAEGKVRMIGFSGKTVAGNLKFAGCADLLMVTYNASETAQAPVMAAAARNGCGILVKKALASGHDRQPVAALQRALAVPGATSVVVGTLSVSHLRANVQAALG